MLLIQELRRKFPLALAITLIFSYLFFLTGISFFENYRICFVLLFQLLPGILIWETIYPNDLNSPVSVGAGLTIGISCTTICQQLFLHSVLSSISWLFPFVVAVLVLTFQKRVVKSTSHRNNYWDKSLMIIFPFLIIWGLLDQWWWLLPIGIVMGGGAAVMQFPGLNNRIKVTNLSRASFATSIVIATFVTVQLRNVNHSWWIISNDTPFGESLSFSINKWGSTSNISAVGQRISYHWFAYAWSGLTSEFAFAHSWSVLTIVLPIVSCLVISLLTWSLIFELTNSSLSAFIGCVLVLLIRNVVSVTSPSQIFGFMPAILFLIICHRCLTRRIFLFSEALLLSLLTFVLVGSKVSTGVVFISAFALVLIFSTSINMRSKFSILPLLAITGLFAYRSFFGGPKGNISPRFGHGNAGGLIMMGRPFDWIRLHIIVEWVALLLISMPFLIWVPYVLLQTRRHKTSVAIKLLSSSVFVSILCTALIDAAGTEAYFLYVGSFMASILCVLLVSSALQDRRIGLTWRSTLFFSLVGIVLGVCRVSSSDWVSRRNSPPSFFISALPYSLLIVSSLLISVIFAGFVNKNWRSFSLILIVSCIQLFSSTIGNNLTARYEFAKGAIYNSETVSVEHVEYNYFSGSPHRVEALEWLRDNSSSDAIVATNRFCLATTYCGPHKWFLASAISHRQMLIEGYYYSVGQYPEPPWAQKRIDVSERFGEGATLADATYLKSQGVSYFIVDLEFVWSYKNENWETLESAQSKSWEPYATTVFENSEMAILKLN